MVQSVLRWYIGQCERRSLNVSEEVYMVQSILRWYNGQCELRRLNVVQILLRWYIGQCELRSLKYGAKRPQVVHWAM